MFNFVWLPPSKTGDASSSKNANKSSRAMASEQPFVSTPHPLKNNKKNSPGSEVVIAGWAAGSDSNDVGVGRGRLRLWRQEHGEQGRGGTSAATVALALAMPLPLLFDGWFLLLLSFFAGIVPLLFWARMGVALVYHLDSSELCNLTPEGSSIRVPVWILIRFLHKG